MVRRYSNPNPNHFSLVSTSAQTDSIHTSLHQLVHAWARDRQTQQEQQQVWLQMGCLLGLALDCSKLSLERIRDVRPHVEAFAGWPICEIMSRGSPILLARILVHCGHYLLEQRPDSRLYMLLQQVFTSLNLSWHKVERRWLGLYNPAALASYYQNKANDVVALLEQVVEIRKSISGMQGWRQLGLQHHLALTYRADGQVKKAIALLA